MAQLLTSPETLMAGVDTALLLGIFYRLGTLTTKVNQHEIYIIKQRQKEAV